MTENNPKPVVTRFAPSPTGALHIGGARTALFAWAFARQQRGQFILRIEDTDQARSSPQSTRDILRDLQWLGLNWDQGPDPDASDPYTSQHGQAGPYFQSQRLEIYHRYIRQLLDRGLAYPDQGAVRLKMETDIDFEDIVFGKIHVNAADLEDFVIQKADSFPTFHLAVVVDDALMGVTHVIRGQEHLSNTPKHIALQKALGFDHPVYVHTPSILNPDGSKMSKRDKAKAARTALKQAPTPPVMDDVAPALLEAFLDRKNDDLQIAEAIARALGLDLPEINVADFRTSGYLPGALLNYLALLGWNPGDNVERFDLDYLVEHLSLKRIGKSNAKFDRDKLFRFNAQSLAGLAPADFSRKLKDHLLTYDQGFDGLCQDTEKWALFCQAYQPRARTLSEVASLGRFFVVEDDAIVYNPKAVKKNLLKNEGEGLTVLTAFAEALETLSPWSGQAAHSLIQSFCEKRALNMGKVAQPLRVAITGAAVSPSFDLTLAILGKKRTMTRIRRCLERFKAAD